MWENFNNILVKIDDFVWGVPLMVLILAGGLLLTLRLGVLQVRKLPLALKWMVKNEEGGKGEVSSFGALCTALSATIGTGNIVGVATAVCAGGPGALFWMIVAAFLGMATKYAEGLLAIKYRVIDENNHSLGGPFYYIEQGMGKNFKWLAKLFAIFGVCAGLLGIGTITQISGISSAIQGFFDPNKVNTVAIPLIGEYSWTTVIAAVLVTVCVALVLIGGIKRITKVSEIIVPFMAILYVVFCLVLIITNITEVPAAVVTIVKGAFNPQAVTGGVVGTMLVAMQKGVARGIFSNEAGLGSAPIAAAAAKTNSPVRQGLVSMTGVFIDTIIICTMTGISIVVTGAWQVEGLEGVQVTSYAFQNGLPFPSQVSAFALMLCLVFFAFTTILGWDYYSERCLEYLTNKNQKAIKVYRWLYILAVFIGPFLTVSAVWTIADIFNGLMAIPNMIALFALSGVVAKETKDFFKNFKNEEKNEINEMKKGA
ncbi:MAG: alanine:cation symporter family protein [Lachnospiraceae bacterium]|nr:alanine:cation symporter family protein [Lachnospiraceae bacterium]